MRLHPRPVLKSAIVAALLVSISCLPVHAFNNDALSDIAWRDVNSVNNEAWAGTAFSTTFSLPALGAMDSWVMAGTGDFNGDGQLDLLWRNSAFGDNAVWFMNGNSFASSALLTPATDTNWEIVGTGYFSGYTDKNIDILWRHKTTGQNAIWFMNGTTVASTTLITQVTDLNWKIGGAGDFNHDGKADIFWSHWTSRENATWYMDGSTFVTSLVWAANAPLNYYCAGLGFFNSNNDIDVLWRSKTSIENLIWYMDDIDFVSATTIPSKATNWKVGGIGDSKFDSDADGLPDLWERNKFGNFDQTAAGDPDSDGWSNLSEYQNGTNPNVHQLTIKISRPRSGSNLP